MKVRFERSPAAAEQSRGLRVDYAQGKRNIPAWRWNLIVLLLFSPILYFLGRALVEKIWVAAPAVVELKRTTLHAGQGGRIASLVKEGDRVVAGAPLAVILPSGQEAAPQPVPAQAPVLPPSDPREELSGAAQLLAYRKERAATYRQLMAQGAATQAEVANALAQLREAEAAYRRLKAEMQAEDRAAAVRSPSSAPSAARQAETVQAPFAGLVTQVRANPGDWVTAGTDLLTLADDRTVHITAYLDPRRSRYAEPGRQAHLHFRDGTTLPARVVQVRPETAPMPAEHLGPLESNTSALQLVLAPDEPLPDRYRKHGLPLSVRFDFVW